jgi:hypothetical protein
MATVGSLLSLALHHVIPGSAVLLVVGSLIGFNVLAVIVGASVLTLKGHQKKSNGYIGCMVRQMPLILPSTRLAL